MPRLILVVGTPGMARLLGNGGDEGGGADVTPAQVSLQRRLAAQLADRTHRWNRARLQRLPEPVSPEVVSDLWYLQHAALQALPTICLGGADANMLARLWSCGGADLDDTPFDIRIHRDAEWTDLRAVIEGRTDAFLEQAVALFLAEDLDDLLTAIVNQVPPE